MEENAKITILNYYHIEHIEHFHASCENEGTSPQAETEQTKAPGHIETESAADVPQIVVTTEKMLTLREILDIMLPDIHNQRQVFSICKILMKRGRVKKNDFKGAVALINGEYPEGFIFKLNVKDLSSLNVLSLSEEDYENWVKEDSGVERDFDDYYFIAEKMDGLMDNIVPMPKSISKRKKDSSSVSDKEIEN